MLPLGHRCFKLQRNRYHLIVQWGDKSSRPTEVVVLCPPLDLLCCLTASWTNFNSLIWQKAIHSVKKSRKNWCKGDRNEKTGGINNPRHLSPLVLWSTKYIISCRWKTNWGFSLPSQTSTTYYTPQGRAVLCSQDGHSTQYHVEFFRSLIWDICSWLSPLILWS